MISQVFGRLATKELDHVEIMTEGGVGYEVAIPLSAYEALPKVGDTATLHTHLVVREDGWQLYGFATPFERRVFRRVLDAKGVGPALALGMLSALSAERLVRARDPGEGHRDAAERATGGAEEGRAVGAGPRGQAG